MTEITHVDVKLTEPAARVRELLSCLLLTIFIGAFAVVSTSAQDDEKVIRVATELAALEVAVTDKNGVPVRGLSPADFRLFEDGVERPIEFFQPITKADARRPLAVVFALDVSGSMTPDELDRLKAAMQTFTERLADYESYFSIIAFAMNVKTVQSFTNRPDKLRAAFLELERDKDGLSTHAYDAVDTAVRMLNRNAPKAIRSRFPKRAVIVISDGFPVGDTVTPDTVIERANVAESSIYSVILPSYSAMTGRKKPLLTPLEASGLIAKTGGKSYYATSKNLEDLFRDLADEITGSYAIAFYPNENESGRQHLVRIEPRAKNYTVRQNRDRVTSK